MYVYKTVQFEQFMASCSHKHMAEHTATSHGCLSAARRFLALPRSSPATSAALAALAGPPSGYLPRQPGWPPWALEIFTSAVFTYTQRLVEK